MDIKICVLAVVFVCVAPRSQAIFLEPHLTALAAAKGAVLKAGVTALASKGAAIGGAVLGAKASAIAAASKLPQILANKPAIVEPCLPEIPTVLDKVSGLWNILRSAVHTKADLVSKLVAPPPSAIVVRKPVIYEINRPKFYPLPVMHYQREAIPRYYKK